MKKTLLDLHIDAAQEKLWRIAQTPLYDSGVRAVGLEGYLKGLQKAKRLVAKQKRLDELTKS